LHADADQKLRVLWPLFGRIRRIFTLQLSNVAGIGGGAPAGLVLKIDVRHGNAVRVLHDEAGVVRFLERAILDLLRMNAYLSVPLLASKAYSAYAPYAPDPIRPLRNLIAAIEARGRPRSLGDWE
jgi:hypothetical protein